MNSLRNIRITLATAFLIAAVAYIFFSPLFNPPAKISLVSQIIPTAISSTIGVTIFWLAVSFLFGRVYCSTVCPVGTLQDIAIWLRRKTRPQHSSFRFHTGHRWRYDILLGYLLCLLLGITTVCVLFEPWALLSNTAAAFNPHIRLTGWNTLGIGVAVGSGVSAVILLGIICSAFFFGRGFCTTICPIGTALGVFHERTLYHIEIDPDRCTSCLKCEDRCPSQCIKVVSRYVDNSRCVRCFDCIKECEDDAIHFQPNRNRRPATPLLQKKKKA
ncbi:MAG: 4Fe-4S binding protein [Clostridium sp.]|nr:4Fe-4S binding protein [Prevotella sp.]MCM1429134.1 4Fe-4S binding protein [Clostridium sp.]MCM1475338.1 4Fe-4S binding protein [Muribaculaceae bacterium]